MTNMPNYLSNDVVKAIQEFINMEGLDSIYDDALPLGRRIFDIVQKKCVVVFYPIMDAYEKNDGFLLADMPLNNGEMMNIMYINTFQTEEKQVFAAAHELGHYLKVDTYVREKCNCMVDSEDIVNRFAAELLMPRRHFRDTFFEFAKSKESINGTLNNYSMLECIVEMMNWFTVPYNATVIRLVEVEIISRNDGIMLVDGDERLAKDIIQKTVRKISSLEKYTNLNVISKRREIVGIDKYKNLDNLLKKADEDGLISDVKMNRLREEFGIVNDVKDVFKNTIKITEE